MLRQIFWAFLFWGSFCFGLETKECPWYVKDLTRPVPNHYELEGGAVVDTSYGVIRITHPDLYVPQETEPSFEKLPFIRTNRGIQDGDGELSLSEIYPPEMIPTKENVFGEHVLDAGCSDGVFVFELLQMGAIAKGIDAYLNPLQLNYPLIFRQRDLRSTGYQNDEFRKIWYTWGALSWDAENFILNQDILRELGRILQVKGSIYTSSVYRGLKVLEKIISLMPNLKINAVVPMPDNPRQVAAEIIKVKD